MWSQRLIKSWIRASCPVASLGLLAVLAACSVAPKRASEHQWTIVTPSTGAKAGSAGKAGRPGTGELAAGQPGTGRAGTGQGGQAGTVPPPVPAEARQAFDRALTLARAGNAAAAETQLASMAQRYPQFSTPLVDLGILLRKDGKLQLAAKALREAVGRDSHSALAWTELGVTQRLEGKFRDAEESYGRAIAADPAYAPVYRDRGVLRDLYLDQPAAALGDFEQYRKLAGGDKPVLMWIAELAHRTGIKVPPQARN